MVCSPAAVWSIIYLSGFSTSFLLFSSLTRFCVDRTKIRLLIAGTSTLRSSISPSFCDSTTLHLIGTKFSIPSRSSSAFTFISRWYVTLIGNHVLGSPHIVVSRPMLSSNSFVVIISLWSSVALWLQHFTIDAMSVPPDFLPFKAQR